MSDLSLWGEGLRGLAPLREATVYTQVFRSVIAEILAPKSPNLGDFKLKFRVQSPPILMSHCVGRVPRLKASDVGGFRGLKDLKRSDTDLCVHGRLREEGKLAAHRVSSFDFIKISKWCSPIDGKSIVGHGSLKPFGKEVEFGSPLLELQAV